MSISRSNSKRTKSRKESCAMEADIISRSGSLSASIILRSLGVQSAKEPSTALGMRFWARAESESNNVSSRVRQIFIVPIVVKVKVRNLYEI